MVALAGELVLQPVLPEGFPADILIYFSAMTPIRFLISITSCALLVNGFLPTTTTTNTCRQSSLNLFADLFPKQQQQPRVQAPPNFVPPEPKPLAITEGTDFKEFATASAGLALRLATGAFVLGWKVDSLFFEDESRYALKLGPIRLRDSSSVLEGAARPSDTLVLYDRESCPSCKRVREMLNLLDITFEVRPCFEDMDTDYPVPFLVDPNVDITIVGDDDIIEHLLEKYGPNPDLFDRKALWPIEFKAFAITTAQIASDLRGNPGRTQQSNARPDNDMMKPIEIWSYECSPFVRPVKEKLAALGLPHRVVSCSRGSKNRDAMVERTGRFQVPFIVDENTGIEMFEGPEIVNYLEAVYTTKE